MIDEHDIEVVVETLNNAKVKWVLIGAHAIGILTQPRATVDYDFIVEGQKIKQVIHMLETRFQRNLEVEDSGAGVTLRAIDVDIIASTSHPVFKAAIEGVNQIAGWNVPSLEKLIVLKFMSMISPWRGRSKRTQDLADLQKLYLSIDRNDLDVDEMANLAATVYPRADEGFVDLLNSIDNGEPIEIP